MWRRVIPLLLFTIASVTADYKYDTRYYQQRVDHFSFTNQDTFGQRYMVADQYWNSSTGPIFFYTGNEGDIVMFLENTGFMWEIAPDFQALVVFAEHRYYGESMPYGNSSFEDIKYLGYLSSEQALADYTELITFLKKNITGAADAAVIAFGGSYGGMLAAWGRMKYPHIYQGAIASSAPILQFTDITPCGTFNQIVTKSFRSVSEICAANVRKSWDALNNFSTTDDGLKWLSTNFNLCQGLANESDFQTFKGWINDMYGNIAMINYPYPANFLTPLPAWPIKEGCYFLNASYSNDADLLVALSNFINFYFNYTGEATCFSIADDSSGLGEQGWDFQSCTEMVMPMCTDGESDMFEPVPWNLTSYAEQCRQKYNVTPQEYMAEMIYGGLNISAASNIVFSNGLLDPWSGGGVLNSVSDSVVAVLIREAAHHLDLRAANPNDPPSVVKARELEISYIQQWLSPSTSRESSDKDIGSWKKLSFKNDILKQYYWKQVPFRFKQEN